jgi:hypothetical protein
LGDLWFDTTLDEMNIYNGFVWQSLVPTVSGADYKNHVAKHYWGGVDPIEFHKLSPEIRVASEFATSGSGTKSNPYGVNDGLSGIQRAHDDLPDYGGMIFLPQGVYEINETILFNKQVKLFGSIGFPTHNLSIGSTIQLAPHSDINTMFEISGTPTGHIFFTHFYGLEIYGNRGLNSDHDITAIHFKQNCSDSIIENVIIYNLKGTCIDLDHGWLNKFDKLWLEVIYGNGIVSNNPSGCTDDTAVTNCRFGSITNRTIWLNELGQCEWIIRDNWFEGNGDQSINMTNADAVSIIGNKFSNRANPPDGAYQPDIHLYAPSGLSNGSDYIIISNNFFDGGNAPTTGREYAIIAGGYNRYFTISGNYFQDYMTGAFNLHANRGWIDGNTFANCQQGYFSRSGGTVNITGTTLVVAVYHLMDYGPNPEDIYIHTISNWSASNVEMWWVDTITTEYFYLHVYPAPGAGNWIEFAWKVIRPEYYP